MLSKKILFLFILVFKTVKSSESAKIDIELQEEKKEESISQEDAEKIAREWVYSIPEKDFKFIVEASIKIILDRAKQKKFEFENLASPAAVSQISEDQINPNKLNEEKQLTCFQKCKKCISTKALCKSNTHRIYSTLT